MDLNEKEKMLRESIAFPLKTDFDMMFCHTLSENAYSELNAVLKKSIDIINPVVFGRNERVFNYICEEYCEIAHRHSIRFNYKNNQFRNILARFFGFNVHPKYYSYFLGD